MYSINFKVLIISFLIGSVFMYLTGPTKKEVIVYSTSDNKNLFQYRDRVNNCYQLKQNEVNCTSNAEDIPFQL